MSEWLYVLDLETTGLMGHPQDLILEVALAKIHKLTHQTIALQTDIVYQDIKDQRVKHCWVVNNNIISLNEIEKGEVLEKVLEKTKKFIGEADYTTYNVEFDYFKFLKYFGFKYPKFCLMERACKVLKLPNEYGYDNYKWPTLQEAFNYFAPEQIRTQTHRALDDVTMAIAVYKGLQNLNK